MFFRYFIKTCLSVIGLRKRKHFIFVGFWLNITIVLLFVENVLITQSFAEIVETERMLRSSSDSKLQKQLESIFNIFHSKGNQH
jgi:hypothetical protein